MTAFPVRVRPGGHRVSAIAKSDDATPDPIDPQQRIVDGAATDAEATIYRAFLAAVTATMAAADSAALMAAIQSGDAAAAEALLDAADIPRLLRSLNDAIEDAFADAGSAMTGAVASGDAGAGPFKIDVRFDRLNPSAASAARTLSQNLTSTLSKEIADTIRRIIGQQVASGQNPAVAAAKIKQVIGLTPQQAQALANYRAALESGKWGVASNYDISAKDGSVIGNAASGKVKLSQARIDELVERYRQRQLRQRAQTIARTESMAAASSGASEAWSQMMAASGYPPTDFRRFWIATNDTRTRPDHVAIPHLNPKGVLPGQPYHYPGGTIMRPHDPAAPARMTIRCRCCEAVRYVPGGKDLGLPIFSGTSILPGET